MVVRPQLQFDGLENFGRGLSFQERKQYAVFFSNVFFEQYRELLECFSRVLFRDGAKLRDVFFNCSMFVEEFLYDTV